jgi:DNA repair exonuclease SbcCD ATPase subunit
MKNDMKKTGTGNKNATAQLADINNRIAELQQQRVGLAEPLKTRHSELQTEILEIQKQIRELDPSWKPASLRPKADDKIMEILTASGQPMTAEQIIQQAGTVFSPWKLKSTLKKRSGGPKAVFTVNDGKYSLKAA